MTGEGRNIFNLAGHPEAIEGQDYEFYCPINLDNEGKVNKNQADYYVVMEKCRLPEAKPEDFTKCRNTQTLEQRFSPRLQSCKQKPFIDAVLLYIDAPNA